MKLLLTIVLSMGLVSVANAGKPIPPVFPKGGVVLTTTATQVAGGLFVGALALAIYQTRNEPMYNCYKLATRDGGYNFEAQCREIGKNGIREVK